MPPWHHNYTMTYNKYKRGHQYLSGGHQKKKNYKRKERKKRLILTLWHIQNNQQVRVDHAAQIHLLNSPPMASDIHKNENENADEMII